MIKSQIPFFFLIAGFMTFIIYSGAKAILIILAIVMSILLLVYFRQNNLVYVPRSPGNPRSPKDNSHDRRHPKDQYLDSVDLCLNVEEGVNLRGWHVKVRPAEFQEVEKEEEVRRIVVYFHENAVNIGDKLIYVREILNELYSDVVIVAYRGYSDSDGFATEEGIRRDSSAIMAYVLAYAQPRNQKIFVIGKGIGSAVAINVCTNPEYSCHIAGMIVEHAFTSISDIVRDYFPFLQWIPLFHKNKWDSLYRIPEVSCPIFFIKSVESGLIGHMDRLQQSAKGCPFIAEYQLEKEGRLKKYLDKLRIFIEKVEQNQEMIVKIAKKLKSKSDEKQK